MREFLIFLLIFVKRTIAKYDCAGDMETYMQAEMGARMVQSAAQMIPRYGKIASAGAGIVAESMALCKKRKMDNEEKEFREKTLEALGDAKKMMEEFSQEVDNSFAAMKDITLQMNVSANRIEGEVDAYIASAALLQWDAFERKLSNMVDIYDKFRRNKDDVEDGGARATFRHMCENLATSPAAVQADIENILENEYSIIMEAMKAEFYSDNSFVKFFNQIGQAKDIIILARAAYEVMDEREISEAAEHALRETVETVNDRIYQKLVKLNQHRENMYFKDIRTFVTSYSQPRGWHGYLNQQYSLFTMGEYTARKKYSYSLEYDGKDETMIGWIKEPRFGMVYDPEYVTILESGQNYSETVKREVVKLNSEGFDENLQTVYKQLFFGTDILEEVEKVVNNITANVTFFRYFRDCGISGEDRLNSSISQEDINELFYSSNKSREFYEDYQRKYQSDTFYMCTFYGFKQGVPARSLEMLNFNAKKGPESVKRLFREKGKKLCFLNDLKELVQKKMILFYAVVFDFFSQKRSEQDTIREKLTKLNKLMEKELNHILGYLSIFQFYFFGKEESLRESLKEIIIDQRVRRNDDENVGISADYTAKRIDEMKKILGMTFNLSLKSLMDPESIQNINEEDKYLFPALFGHVGNAVKELKTIVAQKLFHKKHEYENFKHKNLMFNAEKIQLLTEIAQFLATYRSNSKINDMIRGIDGQYLHSCARYWKILEKTAKWEDIYSQIGLSRKPAPKLDTERFPYIVRTRINSGSFDAIPKNVTDAFESKIKHGMKISDFMLTEGSCITDKVKVIAIYENLNQNPGFTQPFEGFGQCRSVLVRKEETFFEPVNAPFGTRTIAEIIKEYGETVLQWNEVLPSTKFEDVFNEQVKQKTTNSEYQYIYCYYVFTDGKKCSPSAVTSTRHVKQSSIKVLKAAAAKQVITTGIEDPGKHKKEQEEKMQQSMTEMYINFIANHIHETIEDHKKAQKPPST